MSKLIPNPKGCMPCAWSNTIVAGLISKLNALQHAAISAGADRLMSKGERPCAWLKTRALQQQAFAPDKTHLLILYGIYREVAAQIGSVVQTILEVQAMNKDTFEGKWKQIRGEAKSWWGKLTDDDLDRVEGKFDIFTGLLQEKYGYTREAAAEEIDKRLTEYEANIKKEN